MYSCRTRAKGGEKGCVLLKKKKYEEGEGKEGRGGEGGVKRRFAGLNGGGEVNNSITPTRPSQGRKESNLSNNKKLIILKRKRGGKGNLRGVYLRVKIDFEIRRKKKGEDDGGKITSIESWSAFL